MTTRIDVLASPGRDLVDPAVYGSEEVDHYSIPALEATGQPEVQPADEILSAKSLLEGGEVLLSRLNPRKARVVRIPTQPERVSLCSSEFVVLRPRSVDGRFLEYLLLAESIRQHLDAHVESATRSHQRVRPEHLTHMKVTVPSLSAQSAIADSLDAETARVDALIAKKRRLMEVLGEVRWLSFAAALSRYGISFPDSVDSAALREMPLPPGWIAPKLSSVLMQLTNGYVGPTRDILRNRGIRYIQGLHIKQGTINFDRRPYYVEEAWHEAHPRTALRTGDVLIVQTGDIGQVAVVPDDFGVANCHALLIARTNPDIISGPYLGAYLQSRFGYHSLLRVATGALHPHLEFGIRDVPVLVPPRPLQDDLVREISSRRLQIDRLMTMLARQVDLLAERRQAFITAAVTGELDVARPIADGVS